MPSLAIFSLSVIGTFWWLFQWFVYFKNKSLLINPRDGIDTVPLGWFWYMIPDSKYGWTACSYWAGFVVNAVVSVIEFTSYFVYLFSGYSWFGWWVNGFGWWGSVVGLILPWMFAIFQLSMPTTGGGIPSTRSEFGHNAVVLIAVNMIMWIAQGSVHVSLAPRLLCNIEALEAKKKSKIVRKCPLKKKAGMSHDAY
jgi:hypothetical protein